MEASRPRILKSGAGCGWMCAYDPGTDTRKPTITIRNFRLPQCTPSGEQTITVEAQRSECDEEAPDEPPSQPTEPERPVS